MRITTEAQYRLAKSRVHAAQTILLRANEQGATPEEIAGVSTRLARLREMVTEYDLRRGPAISPVPVTRPLGFLPEVVAFLNFDERVVVDCLVAMTPQEAIEEAMLRTRSAWIRNGESIADHAFTARVHCMNEYGEADVKVFRVSVKVSIEPGDATS